MRGNMASVLTFQCKKGTNQFTTSPLVGLAKMDTTNFLFVSCPRRAFPIYDEPP